MNDRTQLLSKVFAAIAHPNRIRMIEMLREGERCQCHLPEDLGIEQSTVSRHIKILISAGVISSRRDGVRIMLSVADTRILDFIDTANDMVNARLNEQIALLEEGS